MTDIVERLRAWETLVSSGYECPAAGTAMHEAAATIERLRAALRWYASDENWLNPDRARAALEERT